MRNPTFFLSGLVVYGIFAIGLIFVSGTIHEFKHVYDLKDYKEICLAGYNKDAFSFQWVYTDQTIQPLKFEPSATFTQVVVIVIALLSMHLYMLHITKMVMKGKGA